MNTADRILAGKTRLMFDHPFFGVLLTQLHLVDATDDPRITTMATDGTRLYYHAPFVDKMKREELVFVLAHEVLHNAFDHHTRLGSRDPRKWNVAADYAINGELVEMKVGKMPKGGLLDAVYTGLGAEEIYRLLPEEDGRSGENPQAGAKNAGADPGGCGQVLPAAAPHDEDGLSRARADMQTKVRQAAAIAKAANAGTLPAGVQRIVDRILAPKIDWRAVLRRFIDECQVRDYSWSRPNRRMLPQGFVFPSLVADGLSHLVVAVDTSGSIDRDTLAAFGAEIDGAFGDGSIDRLTVIYADATVKKVDQFEAGDVVRLAPVGGGGTRFNDTFRWIAENAADASAVIYFTDLETSSFGEPSAAPVLWALWGNHRKLEAITKKAPFGECISLTI